MLRVPLKEPPPGVRPVFAVLALVVIILPSLGLGAVFVAQGRGIPLQLLAPLVMFGIPVGVALARVFRKKRTGALVVDDGAGRVDIDLPGAAAGAGAGPFQASFTELRMLRVNKLGLVLATPSRVFVVPRASFLESSPEDVADAIRGHLVREVAELLQARDDAAFAIERRPLVVTWGTLAVIGVLFAVSLVVAGAGQAFVLHGGARRDWLVDDLELWRVPSAALLHANVLHIFMNGISLVAIGRAVERWFGPPRYVLVLLGSALVGTGASGFVHTDVATVGISGGLFGLLGALAVTTLRYRKAPLLGPRLPGRAWVALVVANGVLLLAPGIDALAHLFGLVAGALIALVVTPRLVDGKRVPAPLRSERAARILALVVLAVCAAGVAGFIWHLATQPVALP